MHSFTFAMVSGLLATIAAAAPATKLAARDDTYYGVSINANVADSFSTPVYEPCPVQINVLTTTTDLSASELVFDAGVAINVDLSSVECRAYKDAAGTVPGSDPFTLAQPAALSTNLVSVGSILCYITESS